MRVLIVGGGIGGFALARFLRQAGGDCTIIERAPRFRPLGHFIALKADGVRVLDRLGIRQECAARALTGATALRYVTASGRLLRRQSTRGLDEALGGYMMLRRADLSDILYRRVAQDVDVRFGTEVTGLDPRPDGVSVALSDGAVEEADVVIGADGIHSSIRRRVFGDVGEQPLGGSYVALEVDAEHDFPQGEVTAFLGRGCAVGVIPLGANRLAAVVYHGGEELRDRLTTPARARDFFAREYAHFHPSVRALFAAIEAESFVFVDTIAMVQLPSLVSGRVALLGDAGACPTFLSGMGSAFAMLSAETLARQLSGGGDPEVALATYGKSALTHAAEVQGSALKMSGWVLGRSRTKTVVRDSVLAMASGSAVLGWAKRFYEGSAAP